jgi:hypothetical protein
MSSRVLFPSLLASLITAAQLGSAASPTEEMVLYVAPRTNGVWFSRSPEASTTAAGNMADSLSAVIDSSRHARAKLGPGARAKIVLRGGTYQLTKPLLLTPQDSGLTLAAYPNEKPVLSGGRSITGWKPVSGKPGWWETQIPAVKAGSWYFRSLFVNGRRAQRTRAPKEGFFRIQGKSPTEHPARLHFRPGDIKPEWVNAGDVELVALLAWTDFRMFIRSIDETSQIATLSTNPNPYVGEENARFFVENAPDMLDVPGEWYLDRKTGTLTYIAMPGEALPQSQVVAPHLEQLVLLQGDFHARRPVEHVTLRGLTFADTDWTLSANGYVEMQAAVYIGGVVRAEGATDCLIEDCTFTRLGGYAVELGRGCQHDRVIGCNMSDLGAGGVRLGEPDKRSEPFEQNHSHVVADNHIHHVGLVYAPAVGVLILQSAANWVAHNEIDHLYYTAVSVGWTWGYYDSPCRENLIEFNHLHHIGQGMLSDMGAVYTLGPQPGTIVRHNLIHDVESFTYGGWGLYTDEGSTGILMEDNLVYHCKSAGFHQHYGRENVIRNNIFAFNREYELMRTRNEKHTSFFFTNNIVLFDSGNLLGGNWQEDRFVMDRNVYWDARPGANAQTLRFASDTLQEWQSRGHDLHSLVADPLFLAPTNLDFQLKTGSPALALGFNPIQLNQVGVRKRTP